ncbi:MAG: alpha-rhamnosidase [Clostridia bacterium]|nr:alpha-rhamnosidase [Clostridia bacterium]
MAMWIWYFGDYELYHHLKLHMRRDEYDYKFPPFWRLDDCHHNVVFHRAFSLDKPGSIQVWARGTGMLEVDGKRYPFDGREIALSAGEHRIEAKLMSMELPSLFVTGAVESDPTWDVCAYDGKWVKADGDWWRQKPEDDPCVFRFQYRRLHPVSMEALEGGWLYDYGEETFAEVCIGNWDEMPADEKVDAPVHLRFGESRAEALSDEAILQVQLNRGDPALISARAFRYVWVSTDMPLTAREEFLPLRPRGSFRCSDERINRIWDVSLRTFHLCSREFFLDGIKRDRWVWSGDAYQSYLINRYCFGDEAIVRRTILALRGKDPVGSHINTILDYSFYWIMSLEDYHMTTGNDDFIRRVWPRAVTLMDYCLQRRDGHGFAANEGNGWIFIDWAEMDKEYAVCAEQMLLLRALEAMQHLAEIVGEDGSGYAALFAELRARVDEFFWDERQGAYIDSFASGRGHVTRHANIFALLFGYAGEKRDRILQNVLLNDAVTDIRTPYFKFYELDALCQAGRQQEVMQRMLDYWGTMIDQGATSVWEEYSPDEPMEAQYGMYGDQFGKSLCHAWGASPIYLLGRWFIGVTPTSPGYATFDVRPEPCGLDWFEGNVPIGKWHGEVHVRVQDGVCTACATVDGGTLYWKGKSVQLERKVVVQLA